MTATPAERNEILYFAYGSNLSSSQMLQRCPSSTPVGLGYLPGWTWLINERGYANVVRPRRISDAQSGSHETTEQGEASAAGKEREDERVSEEDQADWEQASAGVYGVVYLVPPDDESRLDGFEGVPWAYQKAVLDVEIVQAGAQSAEDAAEAEVVQALVYVDDNNTTPSEPKDEYIERMNRGIDEAMREWRLPQWYVEEVMRPFIPDE